MSLSLIAALGPDRLIGVRNALPWRLPADLKRFKQLTMGHPIIMGRKTHESIGRPLPGRQNIVISRKKHYRAEGCRVAHSLGEALSVVETESEVFVIGGAELYREALPRAEKLYLTLVEGDFEGDTYFPTIDWAGWREVDREDRQADAENAHRHTFVTLERRDL